MMSEPPNLPELRASDADRERVAEILRDAVADGRLDMEEFDERLDAVYKSRTYAELEPITRDLPATSQGQAMSPAPAGRETTRWADRIGGTATSRWGVGVLGGFQRRNTWVVPRTFTAVAFCGGGELDLREARFEQRESVIRCFAVMGGVHITVPPEFELVVNGVGIMGGFDGTAAGGGEPGAPRVVVKGFAFWGGVGVTRKRRKAEQQRLKAERHQHELDDRPNRKSLD